MIDSNLDVDEILKEMGISYPINAENRHSINKAHRRIKRKARFKRFALSALSTGSAFALGAFLFGSPMALKAYGHIWSFLKQIWRFIASSPFRI
ncbi:hypothetical protein [Gorillibacterium massiliense]|uniref:hypothetical protein n=1 Tax=Gorillibacterium massiliense TaxID=1280390 RepID=UPI0004B21376|nr:hypothetical protein [Gorillibacterium massiliense]